MNNVMISAEKMIAFLQDGLTRFMEEEKQFGMDDHGVRMHFSWLIGQKEMVECLIGQPVNLQKDGKVTVGF